MRVVDLDSEALFDNTIKSAGDSLVVIDYSTTWCGPCKVIAPKFDELSDKYPDAVFCKVSVGSHFGIRLLYSCSASSDTCENPTPGQKHHDSVTELWKLILG
jgi:thiol-disulfide isomerase/thioredoxin